MIEMSALIIFSHLIVGMQWLDQEQKVILEEELLRTSDKTFYLLFTPYADPKFLGYRTESKVTMYDVNSFHGEAFRCLLRHEINEPMTGEVHSYRQVIEGCNT